MMARKALSSSGYRRRFQYSALTGGSLSAAVVFLSCLLQLCPIVGGLSVDTTTVAFVVRCHHTLYSGRTMPSTNSVMAMRRQPAKQMGLMSRSSSLNDRRRFLVLGSVASNDEATTSSSTSAATTAHSIRMEEQINSGLERAKLILEKSKAKLAAREQEAQVVATTSTASIALPIVTSVTTASTELGNDVASEMMNDLPFFAQLQVVSTSSSSVPPVALTREGNLVKTMNDETGLFTIDGEKMAAQSEQEEWEYRSLSQVFSTTATAEMDEDDERIPSSSASSSSSLADRDVLASIYNLRMQLQQDDYQRIFDTRNRFIGEDN